MTSLNLNFQTNKIIAKGGKMKKFFKGGKCGGCKAGFTLIELLVVIAIIAILSTIVVVTYNSLRKKARDAERKSEIEQIQRLVDIYMVDNANAPSNGINTTIVNGSGIASTSMFTDWKDGLATGPTPNPTYYYRSIDATSIADSYYAIGAKLESPGTSTCSEDIILRNLGANYCLTSK